VILCFSYSFRREVHL